MRLLNDSSSQAGTIEARGDDGDQDNAQNKNKKTWNRQNQSGICSSNKANNPNASNARDRGAPQTYGQPHNYPSPPGAFPSLGNFSPPGGFPPQLFPYAEIGRVVVGGELPEKVEAPRDTKSTEKQRN